MNENTCTNQSSILDQLRAIPEGKQVRFTLRRPDGSEFTHVSAIGRQYIRYPDGFDNVDKEIALATPFDASKGDAYVNEFWVRWTNPGSGRCGIVAIEELAPPLPDLETLRKWVAEQTQVRIEYDNDPATVGYIGASPVTCKLLDARYSPLEGLAISVRSESVGDWNMFLDPVKGSIGECRPLVTSITPVVEKAQTAEEIDTIMQRVAKSGAQVEAITATGDTHTGDVFDPKDGWYRVLPQDGAKHDYWWLSAKADDDEPYRRIVSVRELTPKQTEQEMLALLQQAEREGNHVEATMADGSKRTGAVTHVQLFSHPLDSGRMCHAKIDGNGVSFRADIRENRIDAVKLLPREEKRPVVQHCEPGSVTFTCGPITFDLGSGPFSLAEGRTMTIEKTHITPTCCADVAPYIGRRVRVSCPDGVVSEQVGTLTRVGINESGYPAFWLDDDDDDWGMDDDYYERVTIELFPRRAYRPTVPIGTNDRADLSRGPGALPGSPCEGSRGAGARVSA
jgi:hypothetical protein